MYVIKSIHEDASAATVRDAQFMLPTKLALNTLEGMHLVSWQEILRCEADSNYTKVFLADGSKLIVSKTLGKLEAGLPSHHFVRVHHTHLVNLGSIRCICKDRLTLIGGTHVPISRNGRRILARSVAFFATQI